jgi:SSS family solute:Na+ symporter
MAICFAAVLAVLGLITLLRPMPKPVELPVNAAMDMRVDRGTKVFGGVVVLLTLLLYGIFW